jgi:hypothetical protein
VHPHCVASDAAGTPQGAEFQVNTYTTSYQENPSIGVGAFGGFIVAWDSGGSGETDTSAGSVQARRFRRRRESAWAPTSR